MTEVFIVKRGYDVVAVYEDLKNAQQHKYKPETRIDKLAGEITITSCKFYKKCKVKSRWQN